MSSPACPSYGEERVFQVHGAGFGERGGTMLAEGYGYQVSPHPAGPIQR